MIPAIALITLSRGGGRGLPIPLPLFLTWPLVLLVYGVVELAYRLSGTAGAADSGLLQARAGLGAMLHLAGLQVDVRSAGGNRIRIHLI